jgi:hypothetical protein
VGGERVSSSSSSGKSKCFLKLHNSVFNVVAVVVVALGRSIFYFLAIPPKK